MSKIIDSQLSRRSFLGLFGIGAVTAGLGLVGCGGDADKGGAATGGDSGSASSDSLEKITMVWLPNESAAEFDAGREEFGRVLSEYAGIEVELMTTTDYNVAIEAIASGKAQMANLGAEGYIQARRRTGTSTPCSPPPTPRARSTAPSTTAASPCPPTRCPSTRMPRALPATRSRTSRASA